MARGLLNSRLPYYGNKERKMLLKDHMILTKKRKADVSRETGISNQMVAWLLNTKRPFVVADRNGHITKLYTSEEKVYFGGDE